MKHRPPLFWILLFAFVAGSAWWTVQVPYAPERLYRAIPANATMLSAHYNLAGRWDELAANPLVQSVAGALGADAMDWEGLSRSEGFRAMLAMLASDEVVLAYVPEMQRTREPAWVFAAWLGGDSQRLRWMMHSLQSRDLRSAFSRNGWPVWVWTPRGLQSDERITFAIVEGMVVGCIASQTLGIEQILACFDGHMPSAAERPGFVLPDPADHPDRGWVRLQGLRKREPMPLSYAIRFGTNGAISGTVVAPFAPAISGSVSSVQSADDVAQMVGDLPLACAVVDRSLSRVWLQQIFTNALAREVEGLLHGESPGTVTLSLLGGPYSGHFMAVRLPTVVAGLTVSDPEQVLADMGSVFDRLNAVTQWGLVPQLLLLGTQRVYAIEGTGHAPYASLETQERVAYLASGQSLVFASNLEILGKLLQERDAAGPRAGGRLLDGVRRMRDGHALAYVWFDLDGGGKVLRLAITAWSLKLLMEDPAKSQPVRQRLNLAKAWIDALAPFQQLQVWARPRGDETEFEFKIGE